MENTKKEQYEGYNGKPTTCVHDTKACNEGYKAHMAGQATSANLYQERDMQHSFWLRGWKAALHEANRS